MPNTADVVIIGAGSFGTSLAFHLAHLGVGRVVLIDKHDPVSQTTSRAAGLSCEVQPTAFLTRMASSSVRMIERFETDTGETFTWHQPGSLKIATTDQNAQRLKQDVARGQQSGIKIDLLSPEDAAALSPFVQPGPIVAAGYTTTDIYFEPDELPRAYLRAAQRLGVTVMSNTCVQAINLRGDTVESVVTDQTMISTPVVIDAAGAWSALLGDMVDVHIPVVPTRHQLFITKPIAAAHPDLPIVRMMDVNVYTRPCKGGLMLGGYEPAPMMFDARSMDCDLQVNRLELDVSVLDALARRITEVMPVFTTAEIAEHRGGLPTMTPDGQPLLGPLPGIEGFHVLTGCCVGGLTKSPALGLALAHWIVNGGPDQDMSAAAPDRFDDRYDSSGALVDACRWQYSHHYHKSK